MDWDHLPERVEAWYIRGLKVDSDQTAKGLNQALLYGAGAIAIWALMPRTAFFGWPSFLGGLGAVFYHGMAHYLLWGASFLFLYWSLRGLAIIHASAQWKARQ